MSNKLPSRCETKCAGISHVLSHILIITTAALHFPVYDAYSVNSEKDVIELHKTLSEPAHIAELQSICVLQWLSFPLTLISIYGFKKILLPIVEETPAELIVYVMEKSYILFALFFILVPAVILSVVSYDWTFDESGTIPAGYYVQLCLTILELEIADSMFYANAIFVILVFIVFRFIIWKASNPQNEKYQRIYNELSPRCLASIPCCTSGLLIFGRECVFIGTPTAVFIIVSLILLEFAESGLFSFDSFLKYTMIFIFIINIFLGAGLIWLSNGDKLQRLGKILSEGQTEIFLEETNRNVKVEQVQLQTRNDSQPDTPYTPLNAEKNNDKGFPATS